MRALELAAKCKIRRSWLNELSRRGEVPGARQSATGRWVYPDETPELNRFIRETGRRSEWVRRQQLNVTAAACEKRLRDQKRFLRAVIAAAKRYPSRESTQVVRRAEKKLDA